MAGPTELRDVFDRLVSVPPTDRARLVDETCRGNPELRAALERLLAAHDRAASAFDSDLRDTGDSAATRADAPRWSLTPGTQLGPYVITAPLGAGGMGEVFKARDSRLDRTVAIKVLPPTSSRDVAARHRFEREARAAAALAHPHICTLLDIGRQDEIDYLVIEYLEGQTLAARLARGRVPLAEALTWALQIADALAAAHRAGIVHRDLKPGNVMLTPRGAKLLDFGLARRRPLATLDAATAPATEPLTRTGTIVGTVAYMAPEQLEGAVADERSDIFAFGAVLYEMVTGKRAFGGASSAAIIGNILHAQPTPLSTSEPLTPLILDEVVARCLTKAPADRWSSMGEIVEGLQAARDVVRIPSDARAAAEDGRVAASRRSRTASRRVLAVAALAATLAGATGLGWWAWTRQTGAAIELGATVQRNLTRLTFDPGLQTDPTFSPDGRFVAYASDKGGNFDIWVQPVAGGDAVQVTRSPAADTEPSWSPDGSTIAFRSERDGGGIYLVPALGGPERRITDAGTHPTWSSDSGEVRFLTESFGFGSTRMHRVPRVGGSPQLVLPEFTRRGFWRWIAPAPNNSFSFDGGSPTLGYGFFTVSADHQVTRSSMEKQIPTALSRFLDSSWEVYGRRFVWKLDGSALFLETQDSNGLRNVWRVTVDPGSLAWTRFDRLTTGPGADSNVAVSPDGIRLAFTSFRSASRVWQFPLRSDRVDLDRARPLTDEESVVSNFSTTRNGDAAVYSLGRAGATAPPDVQLADLKSGHSQPLALRGEAASVSPDRRQVAYTKVSDDRRVGFTAVILHRVGSTENLLTPWAPTWVAATDWSEDGTTLLVTRSRGAAPSSIELWPVSDRPASAPLRVVLRSSEMDLAQAKLSPNGRWLAFTVIPHTGGAGIGITDAQGPPDRKWIAIARDHTWVDKPRWGRNGKGLYFLASEGRFLNLWAIHFDDERGLPVGEPFSLARFTSPSYRIDPRVGAVGMDVSQDSVFLTIQTASGNVWMLDNVDR